MKNCISRSKAEGGFSRAFLFVNISDKWPHADRTEYFVPSALAPKTTNSPSVTRVSSMDRHTLEAHGFVCMSFPEQLFFVPPVPGMHCLFRTLMQSSLQSDQSDQLDQCGGSTKHPRETVVKDLDLARNRNKKLRFY